MNGASVPCAWRAVTPRLNRAMLATLGGCVGPTRTGFSGAGPSTLAMAAVSRCHRLDSRTSGTRPLQVSVQKRAHRLFDEVPQLALIQPCASSRCSAG
jgi:hypothetical protein